jgi:ATP-dependent DNA helicase RecG
MEAIELIEVIGRGEDSRTQFKRNVTNVESLAGDLVAFSNSSGGLILIGVDDQGSVTGLTGDDVRRLNQLVANSATSNVRPSINPETQNVSVGGALVMVVSIREGMSKPYSDRGGVFWVKCGADRRRVTSREEIQGLLQGAGLVYADEVPVQGATAGDIDPAHFGAFYEGQYGERLDQGQTPIGQLLRNLGLARGEELSLAGLMLFGDRPERYSPAFVVKAVSFVGNDPSGDRYRDSEDIKGCLRDLYKGTMAFLTRNLHRVQGGKGFNTQGDLEVPPAALDELVVNMLIHRDYFIVAPWRVFIFDDRSEIISPGSLPSNLTVENIRNGVSTIRNPLISSFATKELPYRGIGTGIRRAVAAVPDLELVSDHGANLFTALIPRKAE